LPILGIRLALRRPFKPCKVLRAQNFAGVYDDKAIVTVVYHHWLLENELLSILSAPHRWRMGAAPSRELATDILNNAEKGLSLENVLRDPKV
jgi:hypothetical protein